MKYHALVLFASICLTAFSQTNEAIKVKVTGDRVSLRSMPDVNAELLDRAMRGEELVFLGETNDWMAVQAPDSLHFWVSSEYIPNGIVVPSKLNVRSGPSQNYSVVCVVNTGDAVSLRGEFNEWLKIAPPIGSRVWISKEYVEKIEPPKPKPVAVPEPEPEPVVVEPEPEPIAVVPALTEEEKKPLMLLTRAFLTGALLTSAFLPSDSVRP